MAFEALHKNYLPATSMKVGDKLTGYVTAKSNSEKYPLTDNLEMVLTQDITVTLKHGERTFHAGEEVTVASAGNLKYFFKNGYPLNNLYQITRMPDVMNEKAKKMGSKFEVLCDKKAPKFQDALGTLNTSADNLGQEDNIAF